LQSDQRDADTEGATYITFQLCQFQLHISLTESLSYIEWGIVIRFLRLPELLFDEPMYL